MIPRFYKRCLLWLLPLLVVQALVPVGFMAVAGDRGVTVGFCPVQSARVIEALGHTEQSATHDHHAHHHAHDSSSDADTDAADARSTSCPYALVRTAISGAPVFALAPVTFVQLDRLGIPKEFSPEQSLPLAAHRIRGPPRRLA